MTTRFLSIALLLSCIGVARAQEFHTTYGSALFITPVNAAVEFSPRLDFQPVISASADYSFAKTDHLGFAIGGGYYSYTDRGELVGKFGIRKFNASALAPVGGYWEMVVMGGAAEARASDKPPEPLFGIGVMLGSVRESRFGGLGFEYAGGPSIILTGGQVQVRADFYFGLGYLFGKEVLIEH